MLKSEKALVKLSLLIKVRSNLLGEKALRGTSKKIFYISRLKTTLWREQKISGTQSFEI